jgi:ankyrin repeat protein
MLGLLLVTALTVSSAAAQIRSSNVELVRAVKDQDMSTARELIAAGADVNEQDRETMTALHWAAHWNDLDLVELLLSEGAEAEVSNRYGVTPLHEASLVGNTELIEVLLRAGAQPNTGFGTGETPVLTAARTGNVEAVRILLSNGGSVDISEEWRGQTPLMWAASEGHAEMVEFLIAEGANVNQLSRLIDFGERRSATGGAEVNRPPGGLSSLFFAARSGADAAGEVLVSAGADTDSEETLYGLSPLEAAIINGHWDFATMLIEAGAEVDNGALYTAIEARNTPAYTNRPAPPKQDATYNSMDVIEMLLNAGADPSRVHDWDQMPERQAQGRINVPAGSTPLYRAMLSSDAESIGLLLAHGANASAATRDGSTPLMIASGMRARGRYDNALGPQAPERLDLVKTLLANGARLDSAQGRSGDTAAHYAAQAGNQHLLDYLAAMGADMNLANEEEETPLTLIAARLARLDP